jgi:ribonucleoside-triphosphate reductase
VISLNLPRIALEAKGNEAAFWKLLDERLQLARKALMTRIARLEGVKAAWRRSCIWKGLRRAPESGRRRLRDLQKRPRVHFAGLYRHPRNHQRAVGNQHMYDSEALRVKGVAIVQRLRDAVDQWKEETGYGFSLYSTPSENLCDRFCRLDTAEFGVVEGVTDKGYYTNSFHLDVEKKVNPYDKIDFEARIRRSPAAASFATASTRISSTT